MGDMGDYWRDVNSDRPERRQKHRTNSLESAIRFCHRNDMIIQRTFEGTGQVTAKKYGMVFDIWSTTGSWHIRKGNKRGKGYKHLAKTLKKLWEEE